MYQLLLYLLSQTSLSILVTSIALLFPGLLITKRIWPKLRPLTALIVSYSIGVALLGTQGYVFGWLHFRIGGYLYILACLLMSLRSRTVIIQFLREVCSTFRTIPRLIVCLILMGVMVQSLQMIGNGIPYPSGTNFYRTNAYDGVFHLGLIESMKTTFPPEEPSSSGLAVVNYHYWSDLIISEQSRLIGVSSVFLFFQWTPLILSFLTSLAVYELVVTLSEKESASFRLIATAFALLFLILGSDSGWIFPVYLHHIFTFEYAAIDNGPTQFLNMPHVFGKFFFYAVSLLFLEWRRSKQSSTLLAGLLLTAVSFGLKIYFGIALSLGYLFVLVVDGLTIFKRNGKNIRKTFSTLFPLVLCGILFLLAFALIYVPVNKNAGGLSWYPLEWPKLLINKNNFDWTNLQYKMAIAAYIHSTPKIVLYNIVLVAVGLIAIYGMRLFGFVLSKKSFGILKLDGLLFFYLPALLFTGIGFTTLQVSGGFNVFNFFAVSMATLILTLAFACSQLWNWNKGVGILSLLFLLACMLPRSVYETTTMVSRYVRGYDNVTVTPSQREAFDKVRTQLDSENETIVTSLENPLESKSTYIRAFSGKPVYFAGKYLLETHNQPFAQKEQMVRYLFNQTDMHAFQNMAAQMNVRYIWVDLLQASTPAETVLLQEKDKAVFANDRIVIYDRKNL